MSADILTKEPLTLEDLAVHYGPVELQRPLSRESFLGLAEKYPDLRIERETNGITTIMSPVKRDSGKRESVLIDLLYAWNAQYSSGEVHGLSSGFDLPNGAFKSPDAAWISPERLAAVPEADEESFVTIVPDFVAEVRSSTDRLKKRQSKMTNTWLVNGVRLAWLIDPYEDKAYIYRAGQEVEIVTGFAGKNLSGEDVLPGFELPLENMRRRV